MKIRCEHCGAEFDPRGIAACPACGADFSENRDFAAALAGSSPAGDTPVRQEDYTPGAYNAIPQTPYVPPAKAPEKKKLPAGCWVGLGCMVPVILVIVFLLVVIIGIIVGFNNVQWEVPTDTSEVLTEEATRMTPGIPTVVGDCNFTCRGFEKLYGVTDETGVAVYRFRFTWVNTSGLPTTVYPDEIYLKTSSGEIDRVILNEDWELTLDEYTIGGGKSLAGWICFAVPDEETDLDLRYQDCFLPLWRDSADQPFTPAPDIAVDPA